MHTVWQCLWVFALLHLANAFGHGAVSQQHKLFNQLVGIFRALEVATCGLAFLVNIKVQLFAVEAHGAVLETSLAQALGQAVERNQLVSVLALIALGTRSGRWLVCAINHTIIFK